MFNAKKNTIDYGVQLTSTFVDTQNASAQTADWYLFPDQLKLSNVTVNQAESIIDKLFVKDESVIPIKDKTKTNKRHHTLPVLNEGILCERLNGVWILVCCHYQHDQRCGIIGPILIDEIQKYARQSTPPRNVHCLPISHIGGHRFAGNVIVYPTGTWYGRVLTCHIPLLVDAYTTSSAELKDKLKPLVRGYVDTS